MVVTIVRTEQRIKKSPIEPDPDSPVFTSADGVMTDMGKFQYERACKKFDAALPDYLESQRLLLD